MTKILIVRHGNTLDNVNGIFTGDIDTPLGEKGIAQAKLVCEYLKNNYKVDEVYSSYLSRAINTVKGLADSLGKSVKIVDGIQEIYGGKWEGVLIKDLKELFPEDYSVWEKNVGLSRCTGGESFKEAQERAMKTLNYLAKENEGKTIVVATHGGLIRGIECAVRGIPLEEMERTSYVVNASISEVDYEGGKFVRSKFNINSYLGELQTQMPKGI